MNRQPDLAKLAERFSRILRNNGVKLAVQRSGLFVGALGLVEPAILSELYWCARVTLVSDQNELPIFDRIFAQIFHDNGLSDRLADIDFGQLGTVNRKSPEQFANSVESGHYDRVASFGRQYSGAVEANADRDDSEDEGTSGVPLVANDLESLRKRNFLDVSEDERKSVESLLTSLPYKLPKRRSFRLSVGYSRGDRIDLRHSIREAHRTGGDVVHLWRRRYKEKDRKVVALVDISGSMEPYRDFYLSFFHNFALVHSIEIFTLATRLTRVTRELSRNIPAGPLAGIGGMDLDWSSGTTIGRAISEFLNVYGRKGMSRRAIVLIVSDGWESGDTSILGEQMRRLSLLAHRIIWVNPRSANAQYRPLTGGMQAVLPYCDELLSGHSIESLGQLIETMIR